MNLPPSQSPFMAQEDYPEGSLLVMFTECCKIKGDPVLNFSLWPCALAPCYRTHPKTTAGLLTCFSSGSSYVCQPVFSCRVQGSWAFLLPPES